MAKSISEFVCQQCGYKSPQFLGKCPECGEWNSLVETLISAQNPKTEVRDFDIDVQLFKLSDVKNLKVTRLTSGFGELDRVLGGGIVPGSIVLISGEPGIGKSTLLLESAMRVAGASEGPAGFRLTSTSSQLKRKNRLPESEQTVVGARAGIPTQSRTNVLYVSGEESAQQVKIRADRIGKIPSNLYIFAETDVDNIVTASEKLKPKLLIIDSIQTLSSQKLTGAAGAIGQLRECSQQLQRYAKSSHTPIFIVGHVTKEGTIAGPKVLEHLVDTVLNLEGDEMYAFRILRAIKNRFGSTFEVGVFEMQDIGMVEVKNPSGIFLEYRTNSAGSVVCATVAGGRPILAEIQALVSQTVYPVPTRRVTGLDFSRVQVVAASLSRAMRLALGTFDVYVNVAGGLKITEPGSDLAVALAIASAARDIPLKRGVCVFGEVGLLGELRPVANEKSRISEAKRLGFGDFVSASKFKTLKEAVDYSLLKVK